MEIGDEWKPYDYFGQVREVIAQRQQWKVEPDAVQLGFFSFNKLLMFRDLAIDAWPDRALADHALTRGLLYEGFDREAPLFGSNDRLDEALPPEKLFHVVDADASQAKVIEEVRSGRSLVVQGPPGTGKSQTITNIIAAAAKEGKRVLFLAEKMAALSVVHERLVKVGLRDLCLELHSKTANKKAVLGELARTIVQASAIPKVPGGPVALREVRDRLNLIADALHRQIGETGETAYSVLGRQSRFIGAGYPPPSLNADCLTTMSREEEVKLVVVIERYGALLDAEGRGLEHPFEGARNLDLQPVDLSRLTALLTRAEGTATAFSSAVRKPLEVLVLTNPATLSITSALADLLERLEGLPPGATETAGAMLSSPDLPRLRKALQAGVSWRVAHDEVATVFVDPAFEASVASLRGSLVAGSQSFFARWGKAYRNASRELAGLLRGPLPKPASERVALVDRLSSIRSMKAAWIEEENFCNAVLGDAWRGEKTDFGPLLDTADWCVRLSGARIAALQSPMLELAARPIEVAAMQRTLREGESLARAAIKEVMNILDMDPASLSDGGIEKADPDNVADRFRRMAGSVDRYASWAQLARLRRTLIDAGLPDLAERMRAGNLDAAGASFELQFARAERLWKVAISDSPLLRGIAREERHKLVRTFAELERDRLKANVTSILAGHLAQVPQGAQGEMKVIRGEIAKKRAQISVRRLFERAGTAVQRIKPVLLMSPIFVA